jgi:hypothetical protein
MTSWGFISPFITALRNATKGIHFLRAIRKVIRRSETTPDVESAMSMATFTTIGFNNRCVLYECLMPALAHSGLICRGLNQGSTLKVGQSFVIDSYVS